MGVGKGNRDIIQFLRDHSYLSFLQVMPDQIKRHIEREAPQPQLRCARVGPLRRVATGVSSRARPSAAYSTRRWHNITTQSTPSADEGRTQRVSWGPAIIHGAMSG